MEIYKYHRWKWYHKKRSLYKYRLSITRCSVAFTKEVLFTIDVLLIAVPSRCTDLLILELLLLVVFRVWLLSRLTKVVSTTDALSEWDTTRIWVSGHLLSKSTINCASFSPLSLAPFWASG
jgi:hypothetical protein